MFFVNLKYSVRYFMKFKTYTMISITGFTIGLCCCILIALYIQDELGYDAYHEKACEIYRLVLKYDSGGTKKYHPNSPAPMAPVITGSIPEIAGIVRLAGGQNKTVIFNNIETRNNKLALVDKSYFDLFDVALLKGQAKTVFDKNNSVILTQSTAKKLFGDQDPIDQIITVGTKPFTSDYIVTHIVDDPPLNSRFQYDMLASFNRLLGKGYEGNTGWGASNYPTYVLLKKNSNIEQVKNKLSEIMKAHQSDYDIVLQPLIKTHIDMNPLNDLPTDKDSVHIYIFAGIAILILVLASFNYINMSTLQLTTKEKEIGLRKVIGAKQHQLSLQFIVEALILSITSLLISLVLANYFLPIFNHYTGKEIPWQYLLDIPFMAAILIIAVLVGIIAGHYPAFYLSKLKPISNINRDADRRNSLNIKGVLVIIQFAITVIFFVCTFGMRNQMQYTSAKKLGYDKDHLIVLPIYYGSQGKQKYDVFKTEVLKNARIKGVTATSYLPSVPNYYQNVELKGDAANKIRYINWICADYDFINTFGLEILQGSAFSQDPLKQSHKAYIINESAAKQLGFDNPVGEPMKIIEWGEIAGVVKDFHFQSMRHKIAPAAIYLYPELCKYLLVRVDPNAIHESVNYLRNVWKEVFQIEFDYAFYDQDFDKLYKSEMQQNEIFSYISGLSIFISVLGLLGLTLFTVERRTREIGIRKVLGSSVHQIIHIIISDFVRYILYANLLAWPIAWIIMNKWLNNFAYRIQLQWWLFLLAGIITLICSVAAIWVLALRAATANPVEALRYE